MSKSKIHNDFGFLGQSFQIRLISQLMIDHRFAESMIEIIDPQFFDVANLKMIISKIKDYYEKYQTIPSFPTLETIIKTEVTKELTQETVLGLIKEIQEADLRDGLAVQDKALMFCKQQALKKATTKIQTIIDTGDFNRYNECEELMKQALSIGEAKDDGVDIFHDIDGVLSDEFRSPIPTGIKGIDDLMGGGLSKAELGVILAPFGVGKTTMTTKIANSAVNAGFNVVQIFFEDSVKVIQRKHYACWTGISLSDLQSNVDRVKEKIAERKSVIGNLRLKKFPSDGTTIPMIKNYLRKLISQGFKPDMVILDYIDCVVPTKQFNDEFSGEGMVMRQFESMLAELNIAGWTCVQGNRSSIGATVVEANQMGGSIKKGQIGHFIVSIAKTLEQKESGRATLAILKSRFGKDGVIFEDIVFDNGRIVIDTADSGNVSFLDFEKGQVKRKEDHIRNVFDKFQENKNN